MNRAPTSQPEHPFHRGNFKIRYTAEEDAYTRSYVVNWIRTKGFFSSALGGGMTFALMKAGVISSTYTGGKILAGIIGGFSLARFSAQRQLSQELRVKYPDGFAAQMLYLKEHGELWNDYISFLREQQRQGYNRYTPSNQPVATGNTPEPVPTVTRDYKETTSRPAGLDDRFRPQMDGILQGKSVPDEDDKSGKKPKGSYAMWRQQKAPPGQENIPRPPSDLPPYSPPPPDPPRYSSPESYQPPQPRSDSPYEQPKAPPPKKDSQPRTKPVRKNKYGDIIEDE